MQTTDVHAGENESPVASYPYRDKSERNAEIVLTRSRLVFSCGPLRDAYPLPSVRSIDVESGRNIGMIGVLALGMVLALCCAVIFGNTIFLQTPDAPVFMKTVPIGMLVIGLGLLVVLIRFRFGFVRIVIQSDFGARHYELATSNQSLLDFVRTVQQAL